MIQVIMNRGKDGSICEYRVDGHAEYDEPGKDIVCASVSAITVGMYNAIESLLQLQPEYSMRNGFLHVKLAQLDIPDERVREHLQILLEGMLVMLRTIEESYGEYIVIKDNK